MARWIVGLMVALSCAVPASAPAQCCGDCDGSGAVTIDELVSAVDHALGTCAAALQPLISLHGVALSGTAVVLSEQITDGRVELGIETDWAGSEQSDRALFTVATANAFANRVALLKTGRFLSWIVTEASGRESAVAVDNSAWLPGVHTVTASWGGGAMRLAVDDVLLGESTVGVVSIAAGADVQIGAPGSTGTTFRNVLFLAGAR
jgi:hypothetical protein